MKTLSLKQIDSSLSKNQVLIHKFKIVSRGQTAFFVFLCGGVKRSGELSLAVLCRESPDFGDC